MKMICRHAKLALLLPALVGLTWTTPLLAQKAKPITEDELGPWINQQRDCQPEDKPSFWPLKYYDFKGDGNEEAIVVAASCATGTAGPDVHAVIGRNAAGELVELKIPEVDNSAYDSLFGNRNSDLSVKDGLLVETFRDDVQRDPPLIIRYKWNGKEFAVVSIEKTGVFKTSYDCAKAASEVEQAICHTEELAGLDETLGRTYKSLLTQLPAAEQASLRVEQRAWLAARDKECLIYKSWVGCLREVYEKRIEELKKRQEPQPTQRE